MLRPPLLKANDEIRILTTARKVSLEEIQEAKKWLEVLGYRVSLGDSLGLEDHQYGGNDVERAEDFQAALDDHEIKAIWFARGGYGSIRVLEKINWDQFIKNPKWLIGFSDITIWHNLVNQFYGIQTLHALMPLTFPKASEEAKNLLAQNLTGNFPDIRWSASNYNRGNQAIEGEIIGGNLSILYSLLGTKSGFNTNGKILFIEEIDEYLYHIDRMMMSLKLAGKLSGLKGLLVGGFTDMKDNEIPFGKSYQEIILEHTADGDYPVYFDFPAGHIDDNRPLILNAKVKIESAEIMRLGYI
ncbi:MAG: LD-carboxypeptidase [Chitinophagales bacterium]|nr:LD-carboxypeptidase [Chitinophagales bacterium]